MTVADWVVVISALVCTISLVVSWWVNRKTRRLLDRYPARSALDHGLLYAAFRHGWQVAKDRPLQTEFPEREFIVMTEQVIHLNRTIPGQEEWK